MGETIEIRDSVPGDLASIEALYPDAFPDEDLLPLVRELLRDTPGIVSLVAIIDASLVGHVIFTPCRVEPGADPVALLAPLAVAGAWQRQGIGSAIVEAGLQRMESAGVTRIYVLGDPAYYGRFGFAPETDVAPLYPLPAEWRGAWQSKSLADGEAPLKGRLALPRVWLRPELWAP